MGSIQAVSAVAARRLRGDFPSTIDGIPCRIDIVDFVSVPGDKTTWASDWDYSGYEEIEFDVLDRTGRPAKWLECKLTDKDRSRIESEVSLFMRGQ